MNSFLIFIAGMLAGVWLIAAVLYWWPATTPEEEEYVQKGMPAPPDPNKKLIKQLKRANLRLQRVLHGDQPVSDTELIKTINQNSKLLKEIRQLDESNR